MTRIRLLHGEVVDLAAARAARAERLAGVDAALAVVRSRLAVTSPGGLEQTREGSVPSPVRPVGSTTLPIGPRAHLRPSGQKTHRLDGRGYCTAPVRPFGSEEPDGPREDSAA